MNRRQLFGLVGAGTAALLLPGCSPENGESPGPDAPTVCVARSSLEPHATMNRLPLVYEVSERRESFAFDPGFFDQLSRWLDSYSQRSGLRAVDQVWSYGAWRAEGDGACGSWHNSGRGFDLARLRLTGGGFVSCRYDEWRGSTGAQRERALRRYWALAASLHLNFAYVLTYLYNEQHFNHIHVDNGRSGGQQSTLSTRSRTQVQAVQGMCRHLWGEQLETTGRWDSATEQATRRVLDTLGESADLDESVDSWRSFLTASIPRGAD